MTRRKIVNSLLIVCITGVISCSKQKEASHESDSQSEGWAEMDEFHMIMAESFHPYMDSGNLEPSRKNAAAMEEMATEWAKASLPDKVDNDEMKRKLERLKTSAGHFNEIAATADEKILGDSLTKIHDLFHHIQESWYGEGAHDH
jgi:hypothetical protein